MFIYQPNLDKYLLLKPESLNVEDFNISTNAYIQELKGAADLIVRGTELISDARTVIFEYPLATPDVEIEVKQKVWIWWERGVPLKVVQQLTSDTFSNTLELVYSGFSFGHFSDELFKLPGDMIIKESQ